MSHVKTIVWLQRSLREAGKCKDGGTCHHHCKPDPKEECFREVTCVPLGGSCLNDDWTIPEAST